MTFGTVPLLSPGGMSLMTWYHAMRVTISSTPSAQPRKMHGPQGLRVEWTGRVTKWCLLSADCDVQSSPCSCGDHSRGMAGLWWQRYARTQNRNSERYCTRSQWCSRSSGVTGSRILVLKTSLAAVLRTRLLILIACWEPTYVGSGSSRRRRTSPLRDLHKIFLLESRHILFIGCRSSFITKPYSSQTSVCSITEFHGLFLQITLNLTFTLVNIKCKYTNWKIISDFLCIGNSNTCSICHRLRYSQSHFAWPWLWYLKLVKVKCKHNIRKPISEFLNIGNSNICCICDRFWDKHM